MPRREAGVRRDKMLAEHLQQHALLVDAVDRYGAAVLGGQFELPHKDAALQFQRRRFALGVGSQKAGLLAQANLSHQHARMLPQPFFELVQPLPSLSSRSSSLLSSVVVVTSRPSRYQG